MIEYKGYTGRVELDNEAGIFHGEVINLRDVVTFQGESVEELREAFKDSVDDYLEFCAERGQEPERPFSGKFLIRTFPDWHQKLVLQAKINNLSLNSFMNKLIEKSITKSEIESHIQTNVVEDNEAAKYPVSPANMPHWVCESDSETQSN